MKRTSLVVAIFVLVSLLFVGLRFLPEARATTLYVGGGGPGNYTTIQVAIDDANPGDTVYVFNGTYWENVRINKTLSFIGENRDATTIDGSGTGDVVYVDADWVNITGFTIRDSGWLGDGGIELNNVEDCTVMFNRLVDNHYGVVLESSNRSIVSHNNLSGNGFGIRLHFSSNNTVEYNTASSLGSSIYSRNSEHNTMAHNNLSGDGEYGVNLQNSEYNSVIWNNISYKKYGIALFQSNHTSVGNNTISECERSMWLRFSGNNTATGNSVRGGVWGIFVDSSTNITLIENEMDDIGIYLTGSSLSYWNTHAIDTSNTVNGRPIRYWRDVSGGSIPLNAGQVILANCTNVLVENQNLNGGTLGIEIGFSTQNRIANNSASSNNVRGFFLSHSQGNVFVNNTAFANSLEGFRILYGERNSLLRNSIKNNDANGIFVRESKENLIAGNILHDNPTSIWLYSSANNTIANNTDTSSTYGILFIQSDNNTVGGNDIQNGHYGVRLMDSNSNTIANTTIRENDRGIRLTFSNGNTIKGNMILFNSEYGLDLITSSDNNTLFHNDIIGNANQAYDDYTTSQWDNGYPSGGNYWSDYNGTDNCSGPNQDICPDSDGIGDTPYMIEADNQDRYPLMASSAMVPPRPPEVVQAILTGTDLQNVTLGWSLSPDDGVGLRSVVGYGIYRNTTFDLNGIGYQFIASLPNGTSSFVDVGAGEGDVDDYFYRLCAVDLYGNSSCNENQAGKFTRPLSNGHNLVSIPLVHSNESIETVLQTAEYDKAWFYDSLSQEWKWFMKSKGYRRGLWNINHTMGLWVNVTGDCNLTVAGMVPINTIIQLSRGWNLVGFPSFNATYTVSDLKAEIGATRVEGYDPTPPHHLRVLGDNEMLQAGHGYWVRVEADTLWTVDIS